MCVCACARVRVCVYLFKCSIWLLCKDNNPHTMGSDLIKTSYIASVILWYFLLHSVYRHAHIMSNTTVIFFCVFWKNGCLMLTVTGVPTRSLSSQSQTFSRKWPWLMAMNCNTTEVTIQGTTRDHIIFSQHTTDCEDDWRYFPAKFEVMHYCIFPSATNGTHHISH
jgi:hypothetical protein